AMGEKAKKFERQVVEVLESFDFDRAHRTMENLDWTWASLGRIPSKREITAEAGRLLRELAGKPGVLGSGGLRASLKEDGTLSLKFVVCESWSDPSDDSPPQ
ncbi:MAG: hypothetical protein NT005_16295, partial [Spirochaetes bacterium]|nr:hypothetical protein [Spirochaetota bacterium]